MTARTSPNGTFTSGKAKKPTPDKPSRDSGVSNTRGRSSVNRRSKKVLRKKGVSPVIHCMLAPTNKESLLLPTGVLAEVIDFQDPSSMDSAPPWLLGQIEWNKRQVPVFSFSALINGDAVDDMMNKSKILIIKSLADTARVP